MLFSRFAAQAPHMAVLVFQLHPDDGTALGKEQAVHLLINIVIKAPHAIKIPVVVLSKREGLFHEPVGKPAVAAFPVDPGPDAKQQGKPMPAAQGYKPAQVFVPAPVPLALDFLVVNPKYISGHHVDPAGFHL